MSCSSSSAAKFLLIRVPTYRKGTTTTAIRTRPNGVCSPEQQLLKSVWPGGFRRTNTFTSAERILRVLCAKNHQECFSCRHAHLLGSGQDGAGRGAHCAPARCHGPPRHRGAAAPDGRQPEQPTEESRGHVYRWEATAGLPGRKWRNMVLSL